MDPIAALPAIKKRNPANFPGNPPIPKRSN